MKITQAGLKEILHYDPETGVFTWLEDRGAMKVKGLRAGTYDNNGYVIIRVRPYGYKAHRLAFLYMTGEWPPELVDHHNGIVDDNRWENLRPANCFESSRNRGSGGHVNGLKNIKWNAGKQRWVVGIAGHRWHYRTQEQAIAAAKVLRAHYHGEFANHG